jgi:hypothetical protein
MTKQIRFGVTNGLRGFFAIIYDDEGPIQSGIGSYSSSKEAAKEAIEWAESEGYLVEAKRLRSMYNL